MFCQELATQIATEVVPSFWDSKVKLVCVGIGTHERAIEFCRHTKFPPEYLFSDELNKVYDVLELVKSTPATLFTDVQTPLALAKRVREGKMEYLTSALSKWRTAMWIPPRLEQGLQQGGAFVFRGAETLYAHKDPSAGAHADLNQILAVSLAASDRV